MIMTIIELPRALAAGRLLAKWLCARSADRGTEFRPSAKTPLGESATSAAPHSETAGNAPLKSLAGGALATRFHAWRGASARRYICTVFPIDALAFDAGLLDFADSVVIAVAVGSGGIRRLVSLCQCEVGADPEARGPFIAEALAAGAVEWHVHLLAMDAIERRAVIGDIDAARRGNTHFVEASA
jgi:hypothetical protein